MVVPLLPPPFGYLVIEPTRSMNAMRDQTGTLHEPSVIPEVHTGKGSEIAPFCNELRSRPDTGPGTSATSSDVRLSGLRTAEQIREAAGVLVEADWLRDPTPGTAFGQRGRIAYAVNPRLWESAK
jgi:hypothetical protein